MGQSQSNYPTKLSGYNLSTNEKVGLSPGCTIEAATWKGKEVYLMNMDTRLFDSKAKKNFISRLEKRMKVTHAVTCTLDHTKAYFEDGAHSFYIVLGDMRWTIVQATKAKPITSLNLLRYIIHSIILSLKGYHDNSLVYTNLRGDNVCFDTKGKVFLSEVGLLGWVLRESNMENLERIYRISRHWQAPELRNNTPIVFTEASDIWSLGITVVQLSCGKDYYDSQTKVLPEVQENEIIDPSRFVSLIHAQPYDLNEKKQLCDFVNLCLKNDPAERATLVDLLQHPFLLNVSSVSENAARELLHLVQDVSDVSQEKKEILTLIDEAPSKKKKRAKQKESHAPSILPSLKKAPTIATKANIKAKSGMRRASKEVKPAPSLRRSEAVPTPIMHMPIPSAVAPLSVVSPPYAATQAQQQTPPPAMMVKLEPEPEPTIEVLDNFAFNFEEAAPEKHEAEEGKAKVYDTMEKEISVLAASRVVPSHRKEEKVKVYDIMPDDDMLEIENEEEESVAGAAIYDSLPEPTEDMFQGKFSGFSYVPQPPVPEKEESDLLTRELDFDFDGMESDDDEYADINTIDEVTNEQETISQYQAPEPSSEYGNFDELYSQPDGKDKVSFSAFAPGSVKPSQNFPLYIWAYLPAQKLEVIARARKTEAKEETGFAGDIAIARNTEVVVQLILPPEIVFQDDIKADSESFIWNGNIENAIFYLHCKDNATDKQLMCKCFVYVNGSRIAIIRFGINVQSGDSYDMFEEPVTNQVSTETTSVVEQGSYDSLEDDLTREKDVHIRFQDTLTFLKKSTEHLDSISSIGSEALRTEVHYISSILACYAKSDAQHVKKWKQKLSRVGGKIPIIDDSILVKRGSDWRDQINTPTAWNSWDLLQLYWTSQACSDEWVDMEWRSGIKMKNEDFIQILRIDPNAPLPKELQTIYIAPPVVRQSTASEKPQSPPLVANTVKMGALLGKGNFGKVNKANWNGKTVVIKRIIADSSITNEDAMNIIMEASVMKRLNRHSNIIKFYSSCLSGNELWLALEYMPDGSLEDYLKHNKGKLSWKQKINLATQAVLGLSQCHSDHIIHRDIAARNFLVRVNEDNSCIVKLSDFGLSKFNRHSSNFTVDHRGSPLKWMSPEGLLSAQFSEKSDVWSFGIVMWEIIHDGADPYPGMKPVEAAKKVAYDRLRLEGVGMNETTVYDNIMYKCWQQDANQRPDSKTIYQMLKDHLDTYSCS